MIWEKKIYGPVFENVIISQEIKVRVITMRWKIFTCKNAIIYYKRHMDTADTGCL